eukprot:6174137-Pleurochrysis_carterae.AAC.4
MRSGGAPTTGDTVRVFHSSARRLHARRTIYTIGGEGVIQKGAGRVAARVRATGRQIAVLPPSTVLTCFSSSSPATFS